MLRSSVLPLLLLSLSGACAIPGDAAWSDLHSTLQAGALDSTLSGGFTLPDLDFGGELESLVDPNLNLPEGESSSRYLAGRLGFAPFELVFSDLEHQSFHPGSLNADWTLPGGGTENASAGIQTEINLSIQKLMLGLDMVNTPAGRFGFLFGVDLVEFGRFGLTLTEDVVINSEVIVAAGESYDVVVGETLPVPLLGLRGDLAFPGTGLRVGGEVSGFYLSNIDDLDRMEYLDMDLNLSWSRGNWSEWTLGYRQIGFDLQGSIEGESLSMDFKISGPYLNFGVVW